MLKLSESVQCIAASATMAISAKAASMKRAGEDVIALAAGEPDFDTPAHIVAAANEALDRLRSGRIEGAAVLDVTSNE